MSTVTTETAVPAASRRFAALYSPAFRALWLGLLISNAGSQMQQAGRAWLVRDLHEEPLYLGLLSLSFALPMLVLTPIGGAIADRFPRVRLLFVTQTGMMLQAALLGALTVAGLVQLWHILVLSFINGVLLALDNPGRQALLPDLVPRQHLRSAVSLSSVAWSGSALFGPALAGLLLGPIGPGGLFLLNAVTFLAIIRALLLLRHLPQSVAVAEGSLGRDMVDGLRYAAKDPGIGPLLLLLTANNVLGRSYIALMPVFARDVLHAGPEAYGLLLTAPGAGAIIGGAVLGGARRVGRPGRVALLGWFGFSLGLVAFALSGQLWLSFIILGVAAICTTLFNASVATQLQLRSPPELRGRVMSLMATSNIGGTNAGGLLSAAAATYLGAQGAVAGGAIILLALGLVTVARRAWRFDSSEGGEGLEGRDPGDAR